MNKVATMDSVEVRQRGEVLLEARGSLRTVTLQHPGKLNAMSRSMWRALKSTFMDLQGDASARCVLVRGHSGHFCAGGDIAEYPAFRFEQESLAAFHEVDVWGALQAMLDCDVPIVAQIEGNCMGAGLEIASCCDLRIAGDSARFGAPIARLGFPMAPREAALVAGAVGATTARAMLLAAEVFDAAHLLRCGFLTHTVPDAQVAELVLGLAERIITLAPQAARLNKQTLRAFNQPQVPEEYAQAAIHSVAPEAVKSSKAYAYAPSTEHREGILAFLEKRPPQF